MKNQELNDKIQQMLAEIARLKQEVSHLKGNSLAPFEPPTSARAGEPSRIVSTTRRRLLRGLAAGLAIGTGMALGPQLSQAKTSVKTGSHIGAVIAAEGDEVIGSLPTATIPYKYGLLALSGTGNFDLSTLSSSVEQVNTAVFAQSNYTGVYGSGNSYGVRAISANGIGVYGLGFSHGVYGYNPNTGVGVFGYSYGGEGVVGSSSTGMGVNGSSSSGTGVNGSSSSGTGVNGSGSIGVYGSGNYGVYGVGVYAGVYGQSSSTNFAGYFQGKVLVTGMLAKPAGSFKIDHPLDPENKYLYHSFVESPDMLNIYNGMVKLDERGEATIRMPEWFEALNSDYRYQLTSIGVASPSLHISQKLSGLSFKIGGGVPGQEVSWQLTGIRQDAYARAHRIVVEEDKPADERGLYLHPLEHGQPPTKSLDPLAHRAPSPCPGPVQT